jgi:hypothetical protein
LKGECSKKDLAEMCKPNHYTFDKIMKHYIHILVVLLVISFTGLGQDGVAHMKLSDGTSISGYILHVGDSTLTIYSTEWLEDQWSNSASDTATVIARSTVIPFGSIDLLELEHSSSAWLIAFPGLPLAVGIIAPALAPPSEGMLDGLAEGIAILSAAVIGAAAAVAIHFISGADWIIDLNDEDDIETLKDYAVLQGKIPEALPALQ